MAGKPRNLKGQVFGKLTVIEIVGTCPKRGTLWRCRCICDNERDVYATRLVQKATRMCEDCQNDARSYVKGWERQIPNLTPEARAMYRSLLERRRRLGITITGQIAWEAFDVSRREFPKRRAA